MSIHQFTASYVRPSFIATPSATPAFGDALEGGFYAGLIWNQVTQSSDIITIATGIKGIKVDVNMNSTPLFYEGQELEVRSRANPNNKMIGTVIGASHQLLTLNVTSVSGSGAFSDWSVMSRYRVIVAPKATGESLVILHATDASMPNSCWTLSEGYASTWAMRYSGNSAEYPAAWWVTGLSIAGKTDWYIPSRDELDLCNRNLKPGTESNSTAARQAIPIFDYKNMGSYGDTSATQGINNHTYPTGSAYTAGNPAQVAAGKNFRTGESEAFVYNSYGYFYWSSSAYNSTAPGGFGGGYSWRSYISYSGQANHMEPTYNGNASGFVRAVRRSII